MNFKLKFHTSATTTLEPYEIIANIQFELKDKKYTGEYVTATSVKFKDNPWRMRWNFEPYMLDDGEFVISDGPDNRKLLTLNYDWRYSGFLFLYSFMIMGSIINKMYDGITFFSVFFAIVLPIDIMRSKGKASELLTDVLKTHA